MSKAFTPPATMSDADVLAVADVRRSVWTGGFEGLGFGLCAGFLGHAACTRILPASVFPPQFHAGKYATLWTLGLGATFSFLGSVTAGKNNVSGMHDVFQRGAKPATKLTEYQEAASGGLSLVRQGSFFLLPTRVLLCFCDRANPTPVDPWHRVRHH